MKQFVLLVLSFTGIFCRPLEDDNAVRILSFEKDIMPNGEYEFSFELSDGTSRRESAKLKTSAEGVEYLAVTGSYTYVGADGVKYEVNYVADEGGFQPQTHLEGGGSKASRSRSLKSEDLDTRSSSAAVENSPKELVENKKEPIIEDTKIASTVDEVKTESKDDPMGKEEVKE